MDAGAMPGCVPVCDSLKTRCVCGAGAVAPNAVGCSNTWFKSADICDGRAQSRALTPRRDFDYPWAANVTAAHMALGTMNQARPHRSLLQKDECPCAYCIKGATQQLACSNCLQDGALTRKRKDTCLQHAYN
eukprot:363764-Chlamydomonas_euryale.AAC.4